MIHIKKNLIVGLFFFIFIPLSGCTSNIENYSNPEKQIFKDITVEEAYNLI